jgi:membrane-associated protease RseP (regulator of RpoE activity)
LVSITHEVGHLLVLLIFKVPVYRLRVGFGPIIYGRNFKKSPIRRLRLGIIPFGLGVAFDSDHSRFRQLVFWPKIATFAGGVIANLFAALIVIFFSGLDILKPVVPGSVLNFTKGFVFLNILLALFQLLPFASFDGGKIVDFALRQFLPNKGHRIAPFLKILLMFVLLFMIFYLYFFWTKIPH